MTELRFCANCKSFSPVKKSEKKQPPLLPTWAQEFPEGIRNCGASEKIISGGKRCSNGKFTGKVDSVSSH